MAHHCASADLKRCLAVAEFLPFTSAWKLYTTLLLSMYTSTGMFLGLTKIVANRPQSSAIADVAYPSTLPLITGSKDPVSVMSITPNAALTCSVPKLISEPSE
jgi:hypothetical protein